MADMTQCDNCTGFSNRTPMDSYVCPNHPDVHETAPGDCPEGDGPLEQSPCGVPLDAGPCPGHYFLVDDWDDRYPMVQTLHAALYRWKTITYEASVAVRQSLLDCTLTAPTDVVIAWDKGVELGTTPRSFWGPDGASRAATPREIWW